MVAVKNIRNSAYYTHEIRSVYIPGGARYRVAPYRRSI